MIFISKSSEFKPGEITTVNYIQQVFLFFFGIHECTHSSTDGDFFLNVL